MPRQTIRDFATALSFNGTNTQVTLPLAASVQAITAYTLVAWMRIDQIESNVKFLSFRNGGTIGIESNGRSIRFEGNGGSAFIDSSDLIVPSRWVHVAQKVDINGNLTGYINGAPVVTKPTTAITTFTNNIYVGSDNGTRWFKGSVDGVRLFSRALTDAEIAQQYYQGNSTVMNGLVGAWLFNEGSGTVATDSTGINPNGAITNATYMTDVPMKPRQPAGTRMTVRDFGTALSFNGTGGNIVTVPHINAYNLTTGVTVSAWVKVTSVIGVMGIFEKGVVPVVSPFTLYGLTIESGVYRFEVSSGGNRTQVSAGAPVLNQWTHVVGTYDGTNVVIYINGLQVSTTGKIGLIDANTQPLTIGNQNTGGGSPFKGIIDEPTLYNRALSLQEIQSIYQTGKYPNDKVAQFLFNEGAGTVAVDASINTNNAVVSGASYTSDVVMKPRKDVNPNLVTNGNFEFAPLSNVPQTGLGYIDGTATGSSNNRLFGWQAGCNSSQTVIFDSNNPRSGAYSLKASVTTGASGLEIKGSNPNGNSYDTAPGFGFELNPNTNYSLTYWMRTNYVSGDSNDGAFLCILPANGAGNARTTINGTKIKTTTGWTQYSVSFTSASTDARAHLELRIYPQTGAGNLVMDAWFDDIVLQPVTPVARQPVT